MTVIATCGEHAMKRIDELREFSKMRTGIFFLQRSNLIAQKLLHIQS